MILETLAALVLSPLDWYRGKGKTKVPGFAKDLLYGAPVGFLSMSSPENMGYMGLAFAVGATSGPSDSYGALIHDRPMHQDNLRWWQFNTLLQENTKAAQAGRAFLWAVPCFAVSAFTGEGWIVGASILAIHPIALPLALKLNLKDRLPWKVSEKLRGLLLGISLWTNYLLS